MLQRLLFLLLGPSKPQQKAVVYHYHLEADATLWARYASRSTGKAHFVVVLEDGTLEVTPQSPSPQSRLLMTVSPPQDGYPESNWLAGQYPDLSR